MRGLRFGIIDGSAQGFEAFTYPRYRGLLLGTEHAQFIHERIALGAWRNERPVGLAFLSRPFSAVSAQSLSSGGAADQRQLLSIMVSSLLRRCGIGSQLLTRAEQLAQASGTAHLSARHSSRLSDRTAFEACLARCHWARPAAIDFRLAGRARWALQAQIDWAPFLARLTTRGFICTSWADLTDDDRAQVKHLVDNVLPEADRQFDPFSPQNRIEPLPALSIMIRLHGRIVGWIQGSRGAMPDSFHYSYGYALPEVQRLGCLVAGVRDVCQRQAQLYGDTSLCVLETAYANAPMRRFMERQLVPYSDWTDYRYLSEKQLTKA